MVGGEEEEARAAAEGDSEFEGGRTDGRTHDFRLYDGAGSTNFHAILLVLLLPSPPVGGRTLVAKASLARSVRPKQQNHHKFRASFLNLQTSLQEHSIFNI